MTHSKIIGVGSYLPEKVVKNSDLSSIVDTSDEWIAARTGIRERRIVSEGQLTSDLATNAVLNALEYAGIKAQDLSGIILATSTPDIILPSTATIVQHKIGANNAFAFDINAVCSGFVYALYTANAIIKSGNSGYIAVIGADVFSKIVDWADRTTCVLFGDGAGAVILSPTDSSAGILDAEIYADGALCEILRVNGGIFGPHDAKVEMVGKEVFRHAVEKMCSSAADLLSRNGIEVNDITWVLSHQANIRIMRAVGERLGVADDKVITTVASHANTSAASIPLALDTYTRDGHIKPGDMILMVAAGAGFTWGAALVRV